MPKNKTNVAQLNYTLVIIVICILLMASLVAVIQHGEIQTAELIVQTQNQFGEEK